MSQSAEMQPASLLSHSSCHQLLLPQQPNCTPMFNEIQCMNLLAIIYCIKHKHMGWCFNRLRLIWNQIKAWLWLCVSLRPLCILKDWSDPLWQSLSKYCCNVPPNFSSEQRFFKLLKTVVYLSLSTAQQCLQIFIWFQEQCCAWHLEIHWESCLFQAVRYSSSYQIPHLPRWMSC